MKRITPFVLALMFYTIACNNPKTETSESTTDSTAMTPPPSATADAETAPAMDSAAMMKAWEDFRTPGEMHKLLESWNGQWNAEVSSWMDPSKPPVKSQATNLLNPIMSGLYQTGHLSGTMMGMHFEGRSITGYDNAKKIFVSTWIDNLGSGIVMMTGTWDEATKTLRFKGTQTDPVTGKDTPIREELKVIDENTHLLTMYGTGMDGKDMKFMEATLKRN
ncbi:MAG TPA: DUF1579 domain-containing protein [Saprospiraceae bacterium]|nr:DUF1579 domain-containing protein [Saprospiraceae bacterium]